MSDRSQGPGWWQASDGKWHPPATHDNEQAALVTTRAIATTALPTAPWYRRWWGRTAVATAGVLGVVAVIAVTNGPKTTKEGACATVQVSPAAAPGGSAASGPSLSAPAAPSPLSGTPSAPAASHFPVSVSEDHRYLLDQG